MDQAVCDELPPPGGTPPQRNLGTARVSGQRATVNYPATTGRSSAKGVIDDMEHERQQHFVLQPFVHFWRKSWADESERPHIENRYSPF